jgi:ribonuclease HI
MGIVLYGPEQKLLWEGGMGIRTDGNNYVAEIAATTILLTSVPHHVHLSLFTDCLSAIHTLNKPALSERRRLRTPARVWASLGQEARQRHPDVLIKHVRSHQGTNTFEQVGNDRADRLAKLHLELTEHEKPIPYYAIGDTFVELSHDGKIPAQDIRKFLTGLEKAEMLAEWKAAPRQGQLVSLFPTKLIKHSKKVWKWSIELRNGHIWTFFILSSLQWLPTKARRFKGQNKDLRCRNCLLGAVDEISHLSTCPALTQHHKLINETFRGMMRSWDSPFYLQKFFSDKEIKIERYLRTARSANPKISLPQGTLQGLATDFYEKHKLVETSAQRFVTAVRNAQKRYECRCDKGSHKCDLKNCWGTPPDLVQLLRQHFALETDAMADALHRQRSLTNWFSPYEEDTLFGASTDFLKHDLSGQNYFINPPFSGKVQTINGPTHIIKAIIEALVLTNKSPAPTRAVLIIPQLGGAQDGNEFIDLARKAGLLEIARVQAGNFRFVAPQSFLRDTPVQPGAYRLGVSIFLFSNQTSWLYDPVNWHDFVEDMTRWAAQNMHDKVIIPPATTLKFSERLMPEGMARTPSKQAGTCSSTSPITLLDGPCTTLFEPNFLRYKGWDPALTAQLCKINKGNRHAAAIGLFQRPLIEEIKRSESGKAEQNTDRMSRTILLLSYNRYREYQLLSKRSMEIETSLENDYGCKDSFHHLQRRPEMKAGIDSKTCLCREIKLSSKKRKRTSRRRPLLTKLPRKKRKRKRDHQEHGRGLLDYYGPPSLLQQTHHYQQQLQREQHARIRSPCPVTALGGTGDAILEARDRSLRFKR